MGYNHQRDAHGAMANSCCGLGVATWSHVAPWEPGVRGASPCVSRKGGLEGQSHRDFRSGEAGIATREHA